MPLTAQRATGTEEAEPVLEDFDLPESALENLAELTGADPASLRTSEGWAARIELEGTPLIVRATASRWSIYAPPDCDPGDAMDAARKLHGLLGEKVEGWDLDR